MGKAERIGPGNAFQYVVDEASRTTNGFIRVRFQGEEWRVAKRVPEVHPEEVDSPWFPGYPAVSLTVIERPIGSNRLETARAFVPMSNLPWRKPPFGNPAGKGKKA